jgi:hypothetical protein
MDQVIHLSQVAPNATTPEAEDTERFRKVGKQVNKGCRRELRVDDVYDFYAFASTFEKTSDGTQCNNVTSDRFRVNIDAMKESKTY